jgi:preprotein translocase subunit SecE
MKDKINPNIFKNIKEELQKVEWPSKQEALHLTLVVVIISTLLGLYIGLFDYIFAQGLKILLSLKS